MEQTLKASAFERLLLDRVDKLLDEEVAKDSFYKPYYDLINGLYKSEKITFAELEILEGAQFLYFDAFVALLDRLPEVKIVL